MRRVNKQSHLQAGKRSLARLKEHGTAPRASLTRKMSFRVRSADQKRAEIKFVDRYGEVAAILLLSTNLQIEIVRDLISVNGSGVTEQSNDVAPIFTIARFRGHL